MLESNTVFSNALDLMENTRKNIFVTGRAGTGKSTLLTQFKNTSKKRLAVVAPTGVSAVNVGGQTMHSFFRFKPDITVDKVRLVRDIGVYDALDTLVIDEVSMVRADLLDCVDAFLRINRGKPNLPFGGVQMVFFGDLYQLPPVVSSEEAAVFSSVYKSPYFFDSRAFDGFKFEVVELDSVFRQKDSSFVGILDAVRHNRVSREQLGALNARVNPAFEPPDGEFFVRLCTLNRMADEINLRELGKIRAREYGFKGVVEGKFSPGYLPCEEELRLKAGAQVMFLNNDAEARWVNGTIGKITGFLKNSENHEVLVELPNGTRVSVAPYTWKIFRPKHDLMRNSLSYEPIGSFTQYPLRLAWAVTIHKGQGKTFDKVIIDFGQGTFATGQAYVALSRCTALDGLVLRRPLEARHVMVDQKIVEFMDKIKGRQKSA